MSAILRPDFNSAAQPSSSQAQQGGGTAASSNNDGEVATLPNPPRRIPITGANSQDIAETDVYLENMGAFFLSCVKTRTDHVRENVPITHVESFHDLEQDFRNWLHEYRQRLRAMDRS